MEENFVSIKNFKHLYKLLNEYSEKKYKKKLDLKQYKKLIGNTINEISIKYKNREMYEKRKSDHDEKYDELSNKKIKRW